MQSSIHVFNLSSVARRVKMCLAHHMNPCALRIMSKHMPAADTWKGLLKEMLTIDRYLLSVRCNQSCVKQVCCEYLVNTTISLIINHLTHLQQARILTWCTIYTGSHNTPNTYFAFLHPKKRNHQLLLVKIKKRYVIGRMIDVWIRKYKPCWKDIMLEVLGLMNDLFSRRSF